MGIGYRIFVIEGKHPTRISQKSFNDFFNRGRNSLSQYSNQIILIAFVVYSTKQRKPCEVLRVDSQKVKVKQDGFLDEEYDTETTFLSMKRFHYSAPFLAEETPTGSSLICAKNKTTVVDATRRFEERECQQRHPRLSYPVVTAIYSNIFQ